MSFFYLFRLSRSQSHLLCEVICKNIWLWAVHDDLFSPHQNEISLNCFSPKKMLIFLLFFFLLTIPLFRRPCTSTNSMYLWQFILVHWWKPFKYTDNRTDCEIKTLKRFEMRFHLGPPYIYRKIIFTVATFHSHKTIWDCASATWCHVQLIIFITKNFTKLVLQKGKPHKIRKIDSRNRDPLVKRRTFMCTHKFKSMVGEFCIRLHTPGIVVVGFFVSLFSLFSAI